MISAPVDQEQCIYSNAAIKQNVKDQKSTFPAVTACLNHFLLMCVTSLRKRTKLAHASFMTQFSYGDETLLIDFRIDKLSVN